MEIKRFFMALLVAISFVGLLAYCLRWMILAILAVALLLNGYNAARAAEYHSNPALLDWIPATCCVTNDCCWEISQHDVEPMENDSWLIKSTGQVVKRTAFSPDNKYYRCACDYDNVEKHWVKHQGAKTRCLFVPMMMN